MALEGGRVKDVSGVCGHFHLSELLRGRPRDGFCLFGDAGGHHVMLNSVLSWHWLSGITSTQLGIKPVGRWAYAGRE